MKEQFIPYNLALELKELGFNEECLGYFNTKAKLIYGIYVPDKILILTNKGKYYTACLAPLWQQAFDWFEDNYQLSGHIFYSSYSKSGRWRIEVMNSESNIKGHSGFTDSKSDAKQFCLEKLIEICKNKK